MQVIRCVLYSKFSQTDSLAHIGGVGQSSSRKYCIWSKCQKRSQFLEAWKPLKSQFLSHPESMLAANFGHTAAPPKCVFYFWQKVLATETKKLPCPCLFWRSQYLKCLYFILVFVVIVTFSFQNPTFPFKNVFHGL